MSTCGRTHVGLPSSSHVGPGKVAQVGARLVRAPRSRGDAAVATARASDGTPGDVFARLRPRRPRALRRVASLFRWAHPRHGGRRRPPGASAAASSSGTAAGTFTMARRGYWASWMGVHHHQQTPWPFFPVLPAAMRVVSIVGVSVPSCRDPPQPRRVPRCPRRRAPDRAPSRVDRAPLGSPPGPPR